MNKLVSALLLAVTFTFYGCPGDTPTPTNPKPNPVLNENFYYKASIDGQIVEFISRNGYASVAGASNNNTMHEQSMIITQEFTTRPSGGVALLRKFPATPKLCSQVEGLFEVGPYPFGSRLSRTDGMVVYFIDDNGTEWASDLVSGAQDTTASFIITEHIPNTADEFSKTITTAHFTCTLYDKSGRKKKLTDGEIKSRSLQCSGL